MNNLWIVKWLPEIKSTKWILKSINPVKEKIDTILSLCSNSEFSDEKKANISSLLKEILIETESLSSENDYLRNSGGESNQDYLGDAFVMHDMITEEIRKWTIVTSEALIAKIKIFFQNHFPWVNIWIYRHLQNQWGFTDYETRDENQRQKLLRESDLSQDKWEILTKSSQSKKFQYFVSDDWIISWSVPLTQNDEFYSLYLYFEKEYEEWVDIGEIEKKFYIYVRIIWFIIEQELKNIRNLYRDGLTWCKTKDFFNKHKDFRNYSVIAIDLDRFKEVNDKYWHSGGDDVLKAFGQIIQSCIRKWEGDAIRLSWDEFCILVKSIDWKMDHVEKILARLNSIKDSWKNKLNLRNIDTWEFEEVEILFSSWTFINTEEYRLIDVYKMADDELVKNKSKEWAAYRVEDALKYLPPHMQLEIIYGVIRRLKEQNLHDCKTCKWKEVKFIKKHK